jgi:hypothetical protein
VVTVIVPESPDASAPQAAGESAGVNVSPLKTTLTTDQLIAKYVALRDKVADIKKAQVAQLAPYNDAMAMLEGILLDKLNQAGEESVRTASGTAYKTARVSVTCNAWSQTLEYIQTHEAWDLLDARVSKTAAQAIIEETGQPIPGVVVRTDIGLNVRRS